MSDKDVTTSPAVVIEHLANELGLEGTTGVPKAQRVRDRVREMLDERDAVEERVRRAAMTAEQRAHREYRQFTLKVASLVVGDDQAVGLVDSHDTILRLLGEVLERGKVAEETLTRQIRGEMPRPLPPSLAGPPTTYTAAAADRLQLLAEVLAAVLPAQQIKAGAATDDVARYVERVSVAGDVVRKMLDGPAGAGAG